MPNAWTEKELALLDQLVHEHIESGGTVDEAFARTAESQLPRHPWSGVLRKLHTLGYRARARRVAAAPDPHKAEAKKKLLDVIDQLIEALKELKQVAIRKS